MDDGLSETAIALLRRRLDGETEVNDGNRPAYRELAAAGLMMPRHAFIGGPEASYSFTEAGWNRRFELTAASRERSPAPVG